MECGMHWEGSVWGCTRRIIADALECFPPHFVILRSLSLSLEMSFNTEILSHNSVNFLIILMYFDIILIELLIKILFFFFTSLQMAKTYLCKFNTSHLVLSICTHIFLTTFLVVNHNVGAKWIYINCHHPACYTFK